MNRIIKKVSLALILLGLVSSCLSCNKKTNNEKKEYGVFLGIDNTKIDKLSDYETVVIDAEYFSKQDIEYLHKDGKTVYSYINLGSVEEFREYFNDYESITLGKYEGWEDERWVDVSDKGWQEHILELAEDYKRKGVDGFFVDNCDVYYQYPEERIYDGLVKTLQNLMKMDKKVIINGGDMFVKEYREQNKNLKEVMTGVNQEEVFTCDDDETSQYYKDYIAECKSDGLEVYVIEYTDDENKKNQICSFCEENSYKYYITDSIELD